MWKKLSVVPCAAHPYKAKAQRSSPWRPPDAVEQDQAWAPSNNNAQIAALPLEKHGPEHPDRPLTRDAVGHRPIHAFLPLTQKLITGIHLPEPAPLLFLLLQDAPPLQPRLIQPAVLHPLQKLPH